MVKMMNRNQLATTNWLLFLAICLSNSFLNAKPEFKQKNDDSQRVVVVARVIGVEVPELGWPMEFQSLKHFYLRIEKVVKGHVGARYIRVSYGYNPDSNPETILPEEMFNGKTIWKFSLSRWSQFDGKADVSKKPGDWFNEEHKKIEGEKSDVPFKFKCVPSDGNQEEANALEKAGKLDGYWLEWHNYKQMYISSKVKKN